MNVEVTPKQYLWETATTLQDGTTVGKIGIIRYLRLEEETVQCWD